MRLTKLLHLCAVGPAIDITMSQDKGKSSGGSPPSVTSNVSVSVALREQAEKLLADNSSKKTFKGEPIRLIDLEQFSILTDAITDLLDRKGNTSVTPVELSSLNAQLAEAKMKIMTFQSKLDKETYAKEVLQKELDRLKGLVEKEETLDKQAMIDRQNALITARGDLEALKAENGRLRKEQDVLKKKYKKELDEGDDLPDYEALLDQRDRNNKAIQGLNNAIQEMNKISDQRKVDLKRYQDTILSLTNELNCAKAAKFEPVDPGPSKQPGTFAKVAANSGTKVYNLYSKVRGALSEKSKGLLKKAIDTKPEDVKDRVYWLHAAVDSTKHVVMAPYKAVLGGLLEDIRVLDFESRKAFSPAVDAILDVLQGRRDALTDEQLDSLLAEVDPSELKMSKAWRKKGIKTLYDYIREGRPLSELSHDDIAISEADEEVVKVYKAFKQNEDGKIKFESKRPGPAKSGTSLYTWARDRVHQSYEYLRGHARKKSPKRPSVRITEWLRRKLGFVGSLLSLPISFLSFCTGGFF